MTGGTGFLGKSVVPLLTARGHTVWTLSRQNKTPSNDVHFIKGDLTLWDAGVDLTNDVRIQKSFHTKDAIGPFDVCLHMAALYDLQSGEERAMKNNVLGTQTALTLAQKIEIPIFINISSVAVTINCSARQVEPEDINLTSAFPDHYARTKALAEKLVTDWEGPLRRLNLRLGVVVGDSVNGVIERIDGPYHCPHLFAKLKPWIERLPGALPLPGREDRRLPLVPVNQAAAGIVRCLEIFHDEKTERNRSLHLIPKYGLPVPDLYSATLRHLAIHKKIKLLQNLPHILNRELGSRVGRLPKEELSYLLRLPRLDESETRRWLGENWCSEFPDYETSFWRGYDQFVSNR